jgi:hypothetical protein
VSFVPSSRTIPHPVLSSSASPISTVQAPTLSVSTEPAVVATPIPPVIFTPATTETKVAPMTTPAPGSFAASLKAMLDEAHAGLEQARADGRARVGAAVDKLNGAKATTEKVTAGMAKQIEDAADSALSDLGQISNDLG